MHLAKETRQTARLLFVGGETALTDVTVASSEAFLALALVLVWLCVDAGPAVLAGLMGTTVVQI